MAMTDEEKKQFEDMQALLAKQSEQLEEVEKAKKDAADKLKAEKDAAEKEAAEKLKAEKDEAEKKKNETKTAEEIQIEIDKTELYKKVAIEAAGKVVARRELLKEIKENDFLSKVIQEAEGEKYTDLPNADLKKAIRIAKEAAKTFKPEAGGNTKKMTTAEALDVWEKQRKENKEEW